MQFVITHDGSGDNVSVSIRTNDEQFTLKTTGHILYGPEALPPSIGYLFNAKFQQSLRGSTPAWALKIKCLAETSIRRGWEYAQTCHEAHDATTIPIPVLQADWQRDEDALQKAAQQRLAQSIIQNRDGIKGAFRILFVLGQTAYDQARLTAA